MADDAPNPRPGASDYRWQSQPSGSVDQPSRGKSRRYWLITLSGLFLALFTIVALWLLLINRTPVLPVYLTVSIPQHNERLFAPLASTRADAQRILSHFPPHTQPETKDRQLLNRELEALAKKPANQPLILHLTAQAVVRDKNVYIIPGDAQPDDESRWVDVREVLKAMQLCGATNKWLILDLAHNFTDPRLGILADRVAETLEAVLHTAKPTFPVLCPCSAGQYSLTAEALQGSVFAYYLDQGLQGHADANRDRSITVKELSTFVEARVDRWARDNRALRQKPRLFFEGNDFAVAFLTDEEPAPAPKLEPYPDRLQKAWVQRDAFRVKAIRRAPRFLHKLEANLLRQEKLWRGGANQKLDWKDLDEDVQTLLADLERYSSEPSAPKRSLPLAIKEPKDLQSLVDSVMTTLANTKDSAKIADVNDKVKDELVKKLQDQKTLEFPEAASVLIEALSLIPQMKPDDVRVAQSVLLTLKPRERFVEHLYVKRLIDLADKIRDKNDPETWVWHADRTQMMLQTMRVHQALLASLNREPSIRPWIADGISDADKLRQEGERKLLLERPSAWKEGYALVQSAKRKYEDAAQTFEALRRGRQDLDRAYAELPEYARLVCDWPDYDVQAEKAWFAAVAEARKLQTFFLDPPKQGAVGNADSVPSYQKPFPELEKLLKKRILAATKEDGPTALQQIHCLLDLPFLTAPERAALLTRQRDLAAKLHALTDKLDQDDNESRRASTLPAERRDPGAKNVGLVRARMAEEMLRMSGFDSKEKLSLPAEDGVSAEEWTRIERAMRDRCGKDLVAALRSSKTSMFSADALNRVVSPWETEGRAELDKEPTRRMNRAQRAAYFQWLQGRYEAEAKALEASPTDQSASEFFAEAARELRLMGVASD